MNKLILIFVIGCLLSITLVSAESIIEQSDNNNNNAPIALLGNSDMCGVGANLGRGNSFTIGITGTNASSTITKISIPLIPDTSSGKLFIHVQYIDGASGLPIGNDQVNGTNSSNLFSGWNNFTITSFNNSQAGGTYFWYFSDKNNNPTCIIAPQLSTFINQTNMYSGGKEFRNNGGGGWFVEGGGANDLYFRVYGDVNNEIPLVNLNSPIDGFTTNMNNVTLNTTIMESSGKTNFTNMSVFVYSSSGLFNSSFKFVTGNVSNTTLWAINGLSFGTYSWNAVGCYINSTGFSGCTSPTANLTFIINSFSIDSQLYQNSTYETSNQFYKINLNLLNTTLNLARFDYNGTVYNISQIEQNGTYASLNFTFDIPILTAKTNTTKQFRWIFNLTSSGIGLEINTSYFQQNVSSIFFSLCNATIPLKSLNITTREESNQTFLNTSGQGTFNYWLGSGTTYNNYSFQNLSEIQKDYIFCIDVNQTYHVNSNLLFDASGYSERAYNSYNLSLSTNQAQVTLYLLLDSLATSFVGEVRTGTDLLTDALVTIQKYFVGEGSYKTISIRKTDSSGRFVESLEINKDYQYIITKNGVTLGLLQKKAICSTAPCEFTLQILDSSSQFYNSFTTSFASNVIYTLTFNDTTKMVTSAFLDTSGLAQYFRLLVTRSLLNNTASISICDTRVYASAGSMSCNLTGNEGEFKAELIISRSPEKLVDFITFVISTIKENLGQLGLFFSLIIIITVALVGYWNPGVFVILIPVAIIILKLMQFLPLSWGVVSGIGLLALYLAYKTRA